MRTLSLVDAVVAARDDGLAAVDDSGEVLTYAGLRALAGGTVDALAATRGLVMLEAANTILWLATYVGCLSAGRPVLIAPAGNAAAAEALERAFAPAVRLTAANRYRPESTGLDAGVEPDPELALMLSTSGSMGSAKCVRLSHANLAANAAAIVEYLGLGSDERGLVNLPTHYSYGLSIVNSHLMANATLLLTARSVIEPEFWAFAGREGATSFAGVPYTYDLLERIDLIQKVPETLRYFTQAGGRLSPRLASRYAALAAERVWRFFVMYGQTEATARMSYMPPDLLAAHPDCIGVAIPGGRLSIVDAEGRPIDTADVDGELIYEGANVMMGYAFAPEDVALPAGPPQLSTGDLARRRPNGLYQITGRLNRFIKIFGNRIGLDDVERLLLAEGYEAIATGIDDKLLVVTRDAAAVPALGTLIQGRLKVPADYLEVRPVEDYPVLASGKVDYAALKTTLQPPATEAGAAAGNGGQGIADAFVALFGEAGREEDASFNSLGGDSLHYVSMVTTLERHIPDLPDDWDTLSIGALALLADQGQGKALAAAPRRYLPSNLDTVRGLACVLIVALHMVGVSAVDGLKIPDSSRWHSVMDVLDLVRLPLFTALAGFIYGAMPATRYGWSVFIARKLRQLVVPMLFATLVFWGLRTLVYHRRDSLFWAYAWGYQHLWYLGALFLIFVVMGLLDVLAWLRWPVLTSIIILVPVIFPYLPQVPVLHIKNSVGLLPFFAFGLLLYRQPRLLESDRVLAVSAVTGVLLLVLSQVRVDNILLLQQFGVLRWVCGIATIITLLRLFPKMLPLEWVAAYSFTIYLWHPAANAMVRNALLELGLHQVPVLFVIGVLAGIGLPIALHRLMLCFPRLSLPVIGR